MCPDDYKIAAYVDNCLSPEELAPFEQHLNACAGCTEKVFFLKKALFRETFFIRKNPLKQLLLSLKNSLLSVKEKIGEFQSDTLELAYRNDGIKRNAITFALGGNTFKIEYSAKQIILSSDRECVIELKNTADKRREFTGSLNAGQRIILETGVNYEIVCGAETLQLEISDV